MSASTRMNRYELGKRVPDPELMTRIAEVLDVPAAFFYAVDDAEAALLLKFYQLPKGQRSKVLAFIDGLSNASN